MCPPYHLKHFETPSKIFRLSCLIKMNLNFQKFKTCLAEFCIKSLLLQCVFPAEFTCRAVYAAAWIIECEQSIEFIQFIR